MNFPLSKRLLHIWNHNRIKDLFIEFLIVISTTVGANETLTTILPLPSLFGADYHWIFKLIVVLVISSLALVISKWPKSSVAFQIDKSGTQLSISFGNVLKQEGVIGIGVNDFFDTVLGMNVSPTSIHGQFLKSIGGPISDLDREIEHQLESFSVEKVERSKGKRLRYSIGNTISYMHEGNKYLLVALSNTGEDYVTRTSSSTLLIALKALLEKARSECNAKSLHIPLFGAGLSRTGIPPMKLLELLLISVLEVSRDGMVTENISIVLSNDQYDRIDLHKIKKDWAI
jgi:hypothetical protein